MEFKVGDYLYSKSEPSGPDGSHVLYYSISRSRIDKVTNKTVFCGDTEELCWTCHTPAQLPHQWEVSIEPLEWRNKVKQFRKDKYKNQCVHMWHGMSWSLDKPDIPEPEFKSVEELQTKLHEFQVEHAEFFKKRYGYDPFPDGLTWGIDYAKAIRKYRSDMGILHSGHFDSINEHQGITDTFTGLNFEG